MILIDKDKLIHSLEIIPCKDSEERATVNWIIDEIDEKPRVRAIPIEWLKNKSKDLADAYWNNVRNKLVLNMNELPLVIDEIVRIWEKENEIN